jgi:erythromycin esterase-like protein
VGTLCDLDWEIVAVKKNLGIVIMPVKTLCCFILLVVYSLGCKTNYIPAAPASIGKPVDSVYAGLPTHLLKSETDLDSFIDAAGNAQVVLLGEATHGTDDFYKWRASISRRLIIEKGFNTIAVEGDWADGEKINRFVHGASGDSTAAVAVLQQFDRWPVWLWANTEVVLVYYMVKSL